MVLLARSRLRDRNGLGRCCRQRSAVHGAARSDGLHAAGNAAAAMALALGRHGGRVCSSYRTCSLRGSDGEAYAGSDLWIVSRVSSGHCRGLRRFDHAARDPEFKRGKVIPDSFTWLRAVHVLPPTGFQGKQPLAFKLDGIRLLASGCRSFLCRITGRRNTEAGRRP